MKKTIKEIKQSFEKESYKLLIREYKNAHQKLDYICPNNHRHSITWGHWQQGQRCPYCSGKAKKTIEEIREAFESEGYTLLTKEYKNNRQKLEFICPNEHKHSISWSMWQQGQRCTYCVNKNIKKTIEEVKESFEKEGYTLLTQEYKNSSQKLKFICPSGHKHSISWDKWNQGQRCSYCVGNAKKTIEEIQDYLRKFNYICLSTKYINSNTKLKMMCPQGHIFDMSFSCFKNKGTRCPICQRSKPRTDKQRETFSKLIKGNKFRLDKSPTNKLYSVNYNFFNNINNEEKAYWFGFILADGCVYLKKGTYRFQLPIKDRDHLYKFKRCISYTGPIRSYHKDIYSIQINDKKFVMNLINKGIIPRKTFKVTFPNCIPNDLLHHFLRGYWDGDGCMYLYDNEKKFGTSVLGTKVFIEELSRLMKEKCNLKSSTFYYVKHSHVWSFSRSAKQALKVCDYLYKDATIFLERKHNKYIKYLESIGRCSPCSMRADRVISEPEVQK